MRLHVAVSMAEKSGRPAIVAVEVRRAASEDGRRKWHFVVGHVERVAGRTVQVAAERVRELTYAVEDAKPCVFVDIGTPQGFALRRLLRDGWPKELHLPHAYERTKFDTTAFALFLEAYAEGRVRFAENLPYRDELDRALILYRGEDSKDLASEDEALVNAACLALVWPAHGLDGAEPAAADAS